MAQQLSKVRTVFFSITLWVSALLIAWQTVLVVIVNELYIAFPNDGALVTALISWPGAVTALVSVLAGWLLGRISTKAEMIIACILVLSGIIVTFVPGITAALVCCFIMAIGAGFANTAAMELISQVFDDERRRASHMGYYNAANAGSGVFLAMASGLLAVNGWSFAFNLYYIALVPLVLSILFIPRFPAQSSETDTPSPARETDADQDTQSNIGNDAKKPLGLRFWSFFISMFIFYAAYCFFFVYSSVYVAENGLGDSVFAGMLTSVLTAGGLVGTLCFGRIYMRLGRKYGLTCQFIQFAMFVVVWSIHSQPTAIIAAFLFGFTYFSSLSMVFAYAADVVPSGRRGFAIGLMTCCTTAPIPLGCTLASTAMALNGGAITPTFPIAMGILLIPMAIETIALVKQRGKGGDNHLT